MARKQVRETRNGVTLTKMILFDGTPRKAVGATYLVQTPRNQEGRKFDTVAEAKKYFNVQASLRPRNT
jgi:hypothetical protein